MHRILYSFIVCQLLAVGLSENDTISRSKESKKQPSNNSDLQRIIGGTRAKPGEFPSVVGLWVTKNDNSFLACTGTIVNNAYVVTAGHCVANSQKILVYIGCLDLRACSDTRLGTGLLHPNYEQKGSFAKNDLGLVRSNYPTIQPPILIGSPRNYPTCTVVGFGHTSKPAPPVLNSILYKLDVYEVQPCSGLFKKEPMIQAQHCAYARQGKQFFSGDSGGPLFCGRYLVGVTSQYLDIYEQNRTLMAWELPCKYKPWFPDEY